MGLTEIDLKVLDFVCLNGANAGETRIAKELRLKPSTVSYSLKKMLREKIILGHRYRVNYARLGLTTTAWLLLKTKENRASLFEVLDELLKFPQVHVASFVTGEFDIALKVIERDVFCIDSFVRSISNRLPNLIDAIEVLVVTKNYKTHNIIPREFSCLHSFDETDFKILDSRMRFPQKELSEIASELGLHRNTVSKRWKAFWHENVLTKKTPVVNPEYYARLNLALKAIVLIDAEPETCDAIAGKLVKLKEVHELNRMLGKFGLMAIIRAADIPSFFDFLKSRFFSSRESGIRRTVSIICLKSKPHSPEYLPQLLVRGMVRFRKGKLVCSAAKNSLPND